MRICSNHKDYEVPLIWTFSWAYNEYWCPYCGGHWDMFGGEKSEEIDELKKRLELYKKATEEYQDAMGIAICESTEWKGVQTKPEDLPEEEKERLSKIREKGWELNIKVEDLK